MAETRTVPIKARIAAWLWDLIGERIVEAAQPAWGAEVEDEAEGEYIGPYDPDPGLVDAVWDDGFERGYKEGLRG